MSPNFLESEHVSTTPPLPRPTRVQFERAYPEAESLRALKRRVDPAGRFSNELWAAYL